MKRTGFTKNFAATTLVWILLVVPFSVFAQSTKVEMPKNKYKVEDDVQIGQEYAAKVEQELPIINNPQAEAYISEVGQRLVSAIPAQFQDSRFRYSFKIVNASDINAFALPGGPMFVNRGLIQVAKNEGELAGVMAHEISHVVLRHGTAQATRQSSAKNQILGGLLVLGGAMLGGQTGAQLGAAIFAGNFVLKYSREYETNADILGSHIMANAGYDPDDLANMFKTIAAQSKGSGSAPEWLSSHPDPQRRYDTIMRERRLLRLRSNLIKITNGFLATREYLASLPAAKSTEQLEQNSQNSQTGQTQGGNSEMAKGNYSSSVALPSTRYQTYQGGDLFTMSVPNNWRQFPEQTNVWFSPEGAYGSNGITHGVLVGISNSQKQTVQEASKEYVDGLLQGNSYLRQSTNYSNISVSGRAGLAVRLSGTSPITNAPENVTIYTTQLRDGRLFYFVAVSPQRESNRYYTTFNNMVRSIRISSAA
ncbi:MAG: M48 family metallopeptidase [Pyrinomonadaceae bacterium]